MSAGDGGKRGGGEGTHHFPVLPLGSVTTPALHRLMKPQASLVLQQAAHLDQVLKLSVEAQLMRSVLGPSGKKPWKFVGVGSVTNL